MKAKLFNLFKKVFKTEIDEMIADNNIKKEYELRIINETYNANCVIDFKTMKACSIERRTDEDGELVTIIGYLRENQVIEEWYLYCSIDIHNTLVEQFNDYIAFRKD